MSSALYSDSKTKGTVNCTLCGKLLGKGYYFTCHICGLTYCYIHMPERCTHQRIVQHAKK